MRRIVMSVVLLATFAFVGCQSACKCNECGHGGLFKTHHNKHAARAGGHGGHSGAHGGGHRDPVGENIAPPAGPPVGTYAYPYYTLRGPRDFLQANPPSIGPY